MSKKSPSSLDTGNCHDLGCLRLCSAIACRTEVSFFRCIRSRKERGGEVSKGGSYNTHSSLQLQEHRQYMCVLLCRCPLMPTGMQWAHCDTHFVCNALGECLLTGFESCRQKMELQLLDKHGHWSLGITHA